MSTKIIFQCSLCHDYNKPFIDQASSVKMAGYWPRSLFAFFMDLDFVSVHKSAKRELGQYPAILALCLVNNIYTYIFHLCVNILNNNIV